MQILDAAQVDEMLRGSEAQLHHGDEAHTARERLRALGQQPESLVQGLRRGVFESLGNHAFLPALITFHSFSGESGISRCVTPSGESASTTEFTIAGEAPIVPASPTPLTPSGL